MLKWNVVYSLNIECIDEDHHTLFSLINELKNLMDVPPIEYNRQAILNTVLTLQEHMEGHFHDEETFMKNIDYPGLSLHQKEHEMLLDYIRSINPNEIISIIDAIYCLTDWIQAHTSSLDFKMAYYYHHMCINY